MALDVQALRGNLEAIFLAMDGIMDGTGDRYMADNIAARIKEYILTGRTYTADSGTGGYKGNGAGKMTIDSGPLADDLYRTFVAEYENDDLAAHIAADIDRACSLPDTVEEESVGSISSGDGPVGARYGARGKFSGDSGIISGNLSSCFSAMNGLMDGSGNAYLASCWAAAADSYLRQGTVTVTLDGSAGSGEGGIE